MLTYVVTYPQQTFGGERMGVGELSTSIRIMGICHLLPPGPDIPRKYIVNSTTILEKMENIFRYKQDLHAVHSCNFHKPQT